VVNTEGSASGMDLMNRGEQAVQAASASGGNAIYLADESGVARISSPKSPFSV